MHGREGAGDRQSNRLGHRAGRRGGETTTHRPVQAPGSSECKTVRGECRQVQPGGNSSGIGHLDPGRDRTADTVAGRA